MSGKREPGGEFVGGTLSGAILADVETADGVTTGSRAGGVVATIGEQSIARSEQLRKNGAERVFRGAPRSWEVENRAELGNVKVWQGAFNGELFPEGSTDDKRTWLQPGEKMLLPIEAGLHFFGNVFDASNGDALAVIERCGGFVLEGAEKQEMRSPARIIGPPIGLPDFIIRPVDGRMRLVGDPIPIYERYTNATKKLWQLPTAAYTRNVELREMEADRLRQRLAEYTLDDAPLYDNKGRLIAKAGEVCDCSPIAHERGVVGCAHSSMNKRAVILQAKTDEPEPNEDEPGDEEERPEPTDGEAIASTSRRRGR